MSPRRRQKSLAGPITILVVLSVACLAGIWIIVARVARTEEAVTTERSPDVTKRSNSERLTSPIPRAASRRSEPKTTSFKDFVNFPEDHLGCLRFSDVWLDGDFERIEDSKDLSVSMSSRDGKHVFARKRIDFADKIIFTVPEAIGRTLSLTLKSDSRYSSNVCCEVSRRDKIYVASVYKIELLNMNGSVLETYKDK
jgi:hypothetical protein